MRGFARLGHRAAGLGIANVLRFTLPAVAPGREVEEREVAVEVPRRHVGLELLGKALNADDSATSSPTCGGGILFCCCLEKIGKNSVYSPPASKRDAEVSQEMIVLKRICWKGSLTACPTLRRVSGSLTRRLQVLGLDLRSANQTQNVK